MKAAKPFVSKALEAATLRAADKAAAGLQKLAPDNVGFAILLVCMDPKDSHSVATRIAATNLSQQTLAFGLTCEAERVIAGDIEPAAEMLQEANDADS